MNKLILVSILILSLSGFAYAQEDLKVERNTHKLAVLRVSAMLSYARATFLFQSERFNSEQTRLKGLADQYNLQIQLLDKKIEKAEASEAKPTTPKPVQ